MIYLSLEHIISLVKIEILDKYAGMALSKISICIINSEIKCFLIELKNQEYIDPHKEYIINLEQTAMQPQLFFYIAVKDMSGNFIDSDWKYF